MPRARTASGCRRESIALLAAHGLTLADVDLFAVAAGPGIVHRTAHRHRDDAGAGVRPRHAARRGLGARGAGARGSVGGARRARSSARGWTRSAAKCSARCIGWTAAPPFERRRGSSRSRRRTSAAPRRRSSAGAALGAAPAVVRRRRRVLYAELIARGVVRDARVVHPPPLLAGAIGTHGRRAAARGAAGPPIGVRPLYVRRPDASSRERERASSGAGRESTIGVDHRTARRRRGHRRRARARRGVVHQSVDARDVSRGAREPGVSFCFLARDAEAARSSASARSGGCSTSCTSTTWRCCRSIGARGVGTALLAHVLRGGRARWARRAPRSKCGGRTTRRAAVRAFGFAVAGVRRGYYTQAGRGRAGAVARRSAVIVERIG